MLNQYQNEIIAAIAILTTIFIYILIKNKKRDIKHIEKQDETTLNDIDLYKEETVTLDETIDKSGEILDEELLEDEFLGSEEGNFEDEKTEIESQNEHIITKREVPPHPKVTKQHFNEFSGTRILVAEDNLINQKVLTGLLAGSGIEIVIANDGKEALDILEKDDNFLMILMDAHMPRVDGFEATRIIRREKKYDHILIVALSGDTAPDDIKKMSDAGMSEHLEKPLRMEALYNIFYAYTGEENTKNSSDYVEVIMTKELNGDKGLEVCGGDEHFYREILAEFTQTYESSTQELGQLLQDGELNKADKLLLDIIGITANIGAEQLHSIAIDIKHSLRDVEEKSYLTLADQYKIHLENLIKDIKEYK